MGWLCLLCPPLLDGVSFSRQVFDRHGRLLRVTLSADGKFRLRTPLAAISPEVIRATEWQEDRYYRFHPGINPVAAGRSAWSYCLGGGHARAGASTISMQLARLRFGLRTRTLHGKLLQMFRALQLERHYTKAQLLEAYLNLAPYGHNVEGIGAASRLYLGKDAAALRRPEAIALSIIPQSPTRRALRVDRENPALTAAQDRLDRRRQAGGGESNDLDREYRLVARPRAFPAPHFTTQMLAGADTGDVRTTLDLDLQRSLQTTRWRIADQFRRRERQRRREAAALPSSDSEGAPRTALLDRLADPAGFDLETVWDDEWRASLLAAALGRVRRQVDPRQFQIFDCYVTRGWSAARVARELGVNIAQVYLGKHRVGALLRKAVADLERGAG